MLAFIRKHPYLTTIAIVSGIAAMVFPPTAFLPAGSAAYSAAAVLGGLIVSASVFTAYAIFSAFNWLIQSVSRYLFPPPSTISVSPDGLTITGDSSRKSNYATWKVIDFSQSNFLDPGAPGKSNFSLLAGLWRRPNQTDVDASELDEYGYGKVKKKV